MISILISFLFLTGNLEQGDEVSNLPFLTVVLRTSPSMHFQRSQVFRASHQSVFEPPPLSIDFRLCSWWVASFLVFLTAVFLNPADITLDLDLRSLTTAGFFGSHRRGSVLFNSSSRGSQLLWFSFRLFNFSWRFSWGGYDFHSVFLDILRRGNVVFSC